MAHCQRLSITGEDGAIVLSLQVPQLPRVRSAPNMTEYEKSSNGDLSSCTDVSMSEVSAAGSGSSMDQRQTGNGKDSASSRRQSEKGGEEDGEKAKKTMEMTKKELIKKYQLHFFVFLIFLATVISVSLSWYYRELSLHMLESTQTIFFDPRARLLTLTDPTDRVSIKGHLGLDMPKWQLPLHCPQMVLGEDPSSRTCEWKNNAVLSINHFGNGFVQCYNVSWDSLHPQHVPYDCINVQSSYWYGPSNQSTSTFPIRGEFFFEPTNQRVDNNGIFSYAEDFYWLSSTGVALRIHGNDPIHLSWNKSGDNSLCILSNHSGPLYHYSRPSHLDYTLCNGVSPSKTHQFMQEVFPPTPTISFPPREAFSGYFWSFKGFSESHGNASQSSLLDLAEQLKSYNQINPKIVLDTAWQANHGDLAFDPELFPNVSHMVSALEDLGSHVIFLLGPSIHHASQNFKQGIDTSRFVLDSSGDVSGLVKASHGVSAVIDVFDQDTRYWYQKRLQALLLQLPRASLRLTYGTGAWLPYKPHFKTSDASPRGLKTRVTETVSDITAPLVVEHTANTRHISQLIPVKVHVTQAENRKCMTGAIDSALALSLMGYPFILLEGLDLNGSLSGHAQDAPDDAIDLYTRWLQLAAFFPAAQISVPPWLYGSEVMATANNCSSLHHSLVLPLLEDEAFRQEVTLGMPILRPVWWLDSRNRTVHDMQVKDSFLIGDRVLVAPVLCTGLRSRDVYVPPGVWEDKHRRKFFLGPTMLRDYPVSLHEVVVLHRHEVEGEKRYR